jgi:hypothetical protein
MKTELVYEIADYLVKKSYVKNQKIFSREYLGRSDKYLSFVKSAEAPLQTDSLLRLATELRNRAAATEQYGGNNERPNAEILYKYSNEVFAGLGLDVGLFR